MGVGQDPLRGFFVRTRAWCVALSAAALSTDAACFALIPTTAAPRSNAPPNSARGSGAAAPEVLPRSSRASRRGWWGFSSRSAFSAELAVLGSTTERRSDSSGSASPPPPPLASDEIEEPSAMTKRRTRVSSSSVGSCCCSSETAASSVGDETDEDEEGEEVWGIPSKSTTELVVEELEKLAAPDEGKGGGEGCAEASGMVCRIIASSDGKLPSSKSSLPPSLFEPVLAVTDLKPGVDIHGEVEVEKKVEEEEELWAGDLMRGLSREKGGSDGRESTQGILLEKIDAIFNAVSRAETKDLKYLDGKRGCSNGNNVGEESVTSAEYDGEEEARLTSTTRTALEDAGFELLSSRDLDLCEALNAGYLLRLSIIPDLRDLDPRVGWELYPERFNATSSDGSDRGGGGCNLPFEGQVLIFRRGYSEEVSEGRLLLPKLDYLQASLVQKSAAKMASVLGRFERRIGSTIARRLGVFRKALRSKLSDLADSIPLKSVAAFVRSEWGWKDCALGADLEDTNDDARAENGNDNKVFRLSRYGGSKTQFVGSPDIGDALNPFLVCEVACDASPVDGGRMMDGNDSLSSSDSLADASLDEAVDHNIYHEINRGWVTCDYDNVNGNGGGSRAPMQLLQRVSVSNLVDFFSAEGRRGLIRRFFSKSTLVEPTYEEVVVLWRPLPKKPKKRMILTPPNFVYLAAEIFGVDDRLPAKPEKTPKPTLSPLEIRAFTDVPMANLLAVLPKTKLVFRPADAFVFDSVSLLSLLAILGSQRYDSPRLDLLAIVSVSLWILRTFFRYSNKLARYDLLVNKFLTSKISHRGPGAIKYVTTEAGSQRALRAGLTHSWLLQQEETAGELRGDGDAGLLTREQILRKGMDGVNDLIDSGRCTRVDVEAALDDLEDLGLISFTSDGSKLKEIRRGAIAMNSLKSKWEALF